MKRLILLLIPFICLFGIQIERQTLSNGMVLLTAEDHKIPMVNISLVVKSGSGHDPLGREGLANLCAELLTYGTKTRAALQIASEIEFIGSSLNTSCNEDYTAIKTRALSRYLDKVMDLVADCAINSQFSESEITRQKGRITSEILRQNDDPFSLVDKTYRQLLFKNHPYGHTPIGFDSTVKAITRNDILDFYRLTYRPDNAILVVVGDFNKDILLEAVNRYFAKWAPYDGAVRENFLQDPSAAPESIQVPRARIVKKDINQSYILLGHYGLSGRDPDWQKARVMNFILGGSGLTSRMALNIREDRGYAYIVYSWFDKRVNTGAFICEVQTKNETCDSAVKLILDDMTKMKTSGITAKELEDAQNYYVGNFPLRFDSYAEKADLIVDIELYDLGLDYFDKFPGYIKAIKIDDINKMARKYLFPGNYVLAIVGNISPDRITIPGIQWEE